MNALTFYICLLMTQVISSVLYLVIFLEKKNNRTDYLFIICSVIFNILCFTLIYYDMDGYDGVNGVSQIYYEDSIIAQVVLLLFFSVLPSSFAFVIIFFAMLLPVISRGDTMDSHRIIINRNKNCKKQMLLSSVLLLISGTITLFAVNDIHESTGKVITILYGFMFIVFSIFCAYRAFTTCKIPIQI